MRVGYLGPEGTVSHEALLGAPGANGFEPVPQPTLPAAVLAVHDGELVDFLSRAWSDWEAAGLTLAQIARTAHLDPLRLPDGMEPGLHVTHAFDPPPMTYANATHAVPITAECLNTLAGAFGGQAGT